MPWFVCIFKAEIWTLDKARFQILVFLFVDISKSVQMSIFPMFLGIQRYIYSGHEWYMNKSLSNNLSDIDRSKAGKFG